MTGKYNEIMDLPHHVTKARPQMLMSDCATAQERNEQIGGHKA